MKQDNSIIKKNIVNHLSISIIFINRIQKTRNRFKTLSRQNHELRSFSSFIYDLFKKETSVQDVFFQVFIIITIILQDLKNLEEFD